MISARTQRDSARFLRTLRVATQTALAHDHMTRGRTRSATSFLALAAKGVDDWRFPASGLMSGDGLVLAELGLGADGARTLTLQAQGAAGLSLYASHAVRLVLANGRVIEGAFNRDGQTRLPVGADDVSESDLAAFEIEFADDAR